MFKQSYMLCSAALVLAVAACDQSTGPSDAISQADANQLASDMDAVSTLGTSDFGLGPSFSVSVAPGSGSAAATTSAPITINNTFTVTKQCPQGGQVVLAGSVVGSGDRTTTT